MFTAIPTCAAAPDAAAASSPDIDEQLSQLADGLVLADMSSGSASQLRALQLFIHASEAHPLPERFTLAGIHALARFITLTQLTIHVNKQRHDGGAFQPHLITDDMLRALQPLQQLTIVTLSRCRGVTDQGMAHLTACTKLERLDLGDVRTITDAMWPHLAHMTSLRDVRLGNSHQLTTTGVSAYCALAAVTYHAAHAARVAAAPHLVHGAPPRVSLHCCCSDLSSAATARFTSHLSSPLHVAACRIDPVSL